MAGKKRRSRTQVRVGFIGCGGNAAGHMKRILEIPEAEIVALNDVNPRRKGFIAGRMPQLAGSPFFGDYKKMLRQVTMDAVVISTPHTLHYEQITASLNRGLHVLVEKPMVVKSVRGKAVIRKAKSKRKVLAVGYQRHYSGTYRYMRKMVAEGQLGRVEAVSAFLAQNWCKAVSGTWRTKLALSGGGELSDSGSHILDMMLWVTNLKPEVVVAFSNTLGLEVDVNDAVSIRFSNGALGNLTVAGNAPRFYENFIVVGTEGLLQYENRVMRFSRRDGEAIVVEHVPDYSEKDRNFIMAILGKEELQTPPVWGLRVAQITEAINKSAAKGGKPVRVAQ